MASKTYKIYTVDFDVYYITASSKEEAKQLFLDSYREEGFTENYIMMIE